MNGLVVVDASLAVKWVVAEPYSDLARSLVQEWALSGVRPVAPPLLVVEASNAFYLRVRLAQLTIEEAGALLEALLSIGVELQEEPSTYQRALTLAHQLNLPALYDAQYLALAEQRGCPLWTADQRLVNAVRASLPWVRWVAEYERTV